MNNDGAPAIIIRPAVKDDANEIIRLIVELADFEKLDPPDDDARKRLINDAFCPNPLFRVLLAEIGGKAVGYAFYFFTYSSFHAKKTLYLEDIYISADHRRHGIGKTFMDKLKEIAKEYDCHRMEWVVLDWNQNAIDFYEKLGAKHLNEWKTYRLIVGGRSEH